jgi:hypothetical protein
LAHWSAAAKGAVPAIPKTMEEWKQTKSTKMNILVRLVDYLLKRDDAPMPTCTDDGIMNWTPGDSPDSTLLDQQSPKQTNKILIYQEFSSMIPCLVSASNTIENLNSVLMR